MYIPVAGRAYMRMGKGRGRPAVALSAISVAPTGRVYPACLCLQVVVLLAGAQYPGRITGVTWQCHRSHATVRRKVAVSL